MRTVEERREISKSRTEGFIDKTLRHTIGIIEDTVFNEKVARQKGFLQKINPLLKTATFLSFIIIIALQKSLSGIMPFIFLGLVLILLSKVSIMFMLKKILPLASLTFLIALPASLNLIIDGKDLIVLYIFESPERFRGFNLPQRIAITEEGLISMLTLIMRVSCSALFAFLMTMTTRPDRFIKSVEAMVPKPFRSIIGITYRYIFFLIRRVEEFIMGLESRRITPVGSLGGRRWVASRIGLLFSLSLELSKELSFAMESRGYTDDYKASQKGTKGGAIDVAWLFFSLLFNGIVIWKYLM